MEHKVFRESAKSIGPEQKRFHDLLRNYSEIPMESIDDTKTVTAIPGHLTASCTLNVYGQISQKIHQQSTGQMEQFISKNRANSRDIVKKSRKCQRVWKSESIAISDFRGAQK